MVFLLSMWGRFTVHVGVNRGRQSASKFGGASAAKRSV